MFQHSSNTPKLSQTLPNIPKLGHREIWHPFWDTPRSGILPIILKKLDAAQPKAERWCRDSSSHRSYHLKSLTQPSQRQSGGAATTHIQQFSPFLSFKKLDAAQPKAERWCYDIIYTACVCAYLSGCVCVCVPVSVSPPIHVCVCMHFCVSAQLFWFRK